MKAFLKLALPAMAFARTLHTSLDASYTFERWQSEFPGAQGTKEVFQANLAKILAHNADTTQTWKMGVNKFTAMTSADFKKFYSGYRESSATRAVKSYSGAADLAAHLPVAALPATFDWREKGVITPVKDQGQCGGCWSFSAAETMESAVAIATGKLMVFAEQQLIDCVPNPDECGGTGGCSGATQELAFNYTAFAGGITLEKDYPYTAATGTCNPNKIKPAGKVDGFVELPPNNYTALMNALVNIGPIAISAAAEPWQLYESGVFSSPCGADVDHAIQLVGYGTDSATGLDYYLVRNSWSAQWGEKGYIRVARYGETPKGEPCQADKTPGDGDGCKGGPSVITVCGLCGILSDSSYPTGAALA